MTAFLLPYEQGQPACRSLRWLNVLIATGLGRFRAANRAANHMSGRLPVNE